MLLGKSWTSSRISSSVSASPTSSGARPILLIADMFLSRHDDSFLLRRSTSLFKRREAKLLTTLVSHFTAAYVFNWSSYFPDTPLQYPPTFDGRLVLYPSNREVRDYFAWRQADSEFMIVTEWAESDESGPRMLYFFSAYKQPVQHRLLGSYSARG